MLLLLTHDPRLQQADGSLQALPWLDAVMLLWLVLEGPTPRARLAGLLWPDKAPDAARNSLRQRLFQQRRQFGADLVTGTSVLSLANGIRHDLADAATLLEGPAVGGVVSGELARWLDGQRRQRKEQRLQIVLDALDREEAGAHWAGALNQARNLLVLDPLSEAAHRRLIRCHYLAGDRAAALQAFDHCVQVLGAELGLGPADETLALLAMVERGTAASETRAKAPVSVLRPPRMIGRQAERTRFEQAWQAGAVVLLEGDAGMGKSRLLEEAASGQVVRAGGRPGDDGVPYATAARLLRAAQAQAGDTWSPPDAADRATLALLLPDLAPPGHGASPDLLPHAMRKALSGCPALTGVVVDDLHFADEASLELMGDLLLEPGTAWHWALACRPAEAGTQARALLDALADHARLVPIRLGPLPVEAMVELIASLGLPGLDAAGVAPDLHRRTGGNPLFLLETLKQAWIEGSLQAVNEGAASVRPATVEALIERRLSRLTPAALSLARLAALAGADFNLMLAEHVLATPALHFADALNELESAQVLHGTAFAHDLVLDAVRRSVPAGVAQHTQAQVAQWLEQHDGEPARMAELWLQAGDPRRALPWLQRAADAARRALRPRGVIEFMTRKAELEQALGERHAAFESLLAAADAHTLWGDGDLDNTLRTCDRIDELASSDRQIVEAGLHRGCLLRLRGEFAAAEPVLAAALERALDLADEALAHRVRMELSPVLDYLGRPREALHLLQACTAWCEQQGRVEDQLELHGNLGTVLDNLGRLDEALPHHRRAFDLSVQAHRPGDLASACGNLAVNRTDAGDLQAAAQALGQAFQIVADHESDSTRLLNLSLLRALVACHRGHYTDALQQAELSLEQARRHQPALLPRALLRQGLCWWHLGQWSRLAQVLAQVPHEADAVLAVRAQRSRLAWAWATAVSPASAAEARQDMAACRDTLKADGTRPDLGLPLRLELADDLAPEQALAELADVAEQARRIGHLGTTQAAHLRAAAIARSVDPARARQEALAALALFDQGRLNTVLLPGELWLLAGRALAATGDPQATVVLQRGRAWLEQTAGEQVPLEFRDAFVHRNAVNRSLLLEGADVSPD